MCEKIKLAMFSRNIVPAAREGRDSHNRRIGDKESTRRFIIFSKEFDGLSANVGCAPKVHIEHLACILLRCPFVLGDEKGTRIVKDDIDASKGVLGFGECSDDLGLVGDVQLDEKKLGGGVFELEVLDHGGGAQSCDNDLACGQEVLCEGAAEACGSTGDCKQASMRQSIERMKAVNSLNQTRSSGAL